MSRELAVGASAHMLAGGSEFDAVARPSGPAEEAFDAATGN